MDIGVELVAGLGGIEALQAVLLQRADQDAVGHLDTLVQGAQVLVVALELLGGDGGEGAVEVVDRLDEVAGEALDGKVLGGLGLARGALLQVAEVGDGAEVLVLPLLSAAAPTIVGNWVELCHAYLKVNNLFVLLLELLLQLRRLVLGRILLLLGSLALLGCGRLRVPSDGGRGGSCACDLLSDGRKGRGAGSDSDLSRCAEEASLEHCGV